MKKLLLFAVSITLSSLMAQAQENYEIQVYASPTVDKGRTMLELHSNFTLKGSKYANDGTYPTDHVFHETIEITHGWTPWFETGFYIFNSIGVNGQRDYVGSHIRPRVAAPEKWHWPVGVSLSLEFGFQKSSYSTSTSSLEIRPIIDKQFGKLYVAFNPTVDKSFAGTDDDYAYIFSPNVKAGYDITKIVNIGFEYYGSTGPFFHYDKLQDQDHQIFLVTDLGFNPNWEFNAGFGIGSQTADRAIFKLILGRRF